MEENIKQLYEDENKTIEAYPRICLPIGSLYWNENDISADIDKYFVGTWQRVKDVFILAAGDTYPGNSSGGEAKHKLTKEELPYLEGTFPHVGGDESIVSGIVFHVGGGTAEASIGYTGNVSMHKIAFGGDQAHNNMPPYETKYCWKRIS